ncbi:6-phosphogluconolactonase [Dactylella cylindrospora]|nr:6-phosphogluconolactonase [Dactylella cylindrospora]
MRFTSSLAAAVLSFIPQALGARLFVGTSSSLIVPLEFDGATVSAGAANSDAAPAPTWQTLVYRNPALLISTNEGPWNGQGSITSFQITSSGSLVKISSQTGLNGLLHASVFPTGTYIAAASYNGRAVVTYPLSSTGTIGTVGQTFQYNTAPGPVTNRQDNSHIHQVVFDPSGKWLIANDLGADLVRIYAVGSSLTEYSTVSVPAGAGPRHGEFLQTDGGGVFYYLVNELGNTIITFSVTYPSNGIQLSPIQTSSTYGTATVPAKNPQVTAAEIQISPDKKFAYVSNRGDTSFSNPTSDSISAWNINSDGSLSFIKLLRAGGSMPRHFSLDPTGQYVAVALQNSNSVAFFRRDTTTGLWPDTPITTWSSSAAGPVCVQWYNEGASTSTTTSQTTTTTSRTTTRSSTTTTSRSVTTTTSSRTTTTSSRTTTTSIRPTTTTTSSRTTTTPITTTTSSGGALQSLWGQCGGIGWTGPTACASGTCTTYNP